MSDARHSGTVSLYKPSPGGWSVAKGWGQVNNEIETRAEALFLLFEEGMGCLLFDGTVLYI